MKEIEFFPYHNRHIIFRLQNGTELSGVLFDSTNTRKPNTSRTIYTFVPTSNMIAWKKAEKEDDQKKMRSLESEIDIKDIIWAQRLNF
jgi:hypothetical protein